MCMIDGADDGPNEFSNTVTRRAKKEHKCNECRRAILIGERYTYHSWKFDGDFATAKVCGHCQIACDWLSTNCGGFVMDAVREDIQEHVSDYRGRAICIPRLKRIEVGMACGQKLLRGPGREVYPQGDRSREAACAAAAGGVMSTRDWSWKPKDGERWKQPAKKVKAKKLVQPQQQQRRWQDSKPIVPEGARDHIRSIMQEK